MPREYQSSSKRGEYPSQSISRSRSISSQRSPHRQRDKYKRYSPNNNYNQRSYRNDYVDKDDGVRVHVSDLTADCSKRELEEAFGKFGSYKEIWVARNPPCFAFIVYNHRQDAEEAIRKMDNTYISGGRIRVSFARPRTRGTRRGTIFDPNMRCYTCGERGHFSRECPKMNRNYRSYRRASVSKSPSRSRSNHSKSFKGGRVVKKRSRTHSSTYSRSGSRASSKTYSEDEGSPRRNHGRSHHKRSSKSSPFPRKQKVPVLPRKSRSPPEKNSESPHHTDSNIGESEECPKLLSNNHVDTQHNNISPDLNLGEYKSMTDDDIPQMELNANDNKGFDGDSPYLNENESHSDGVQKVSHQQNHYEKNIITTEKDIEDSNETEFNDVNVTINETSIEIASEALDIVEEGKIGERDVGEENEERVEQKYNEEISIDIKQNEGEDFDNEL